MDHRPEPTTPEPRDPDTIFARRTLLGVMGAAFGGALGVAVLGATRNLPAAAATLAAPTTSPQPTVDHSLHAAASPGPSGSPVDHDAQVEAAVKAFPDKTQGWTAGAAVHCDQRGAGVRAHVRGAEVGGHTRPGPHRRRLQRSGPRPGH